MDFEKFCGIDNKGYYNLFFRNDSAITKQQINYYFSQFPGYTGVQSVNGVDGFQMLRFSGQMGAKQAHNAVLQYKDGWINNYSLYPHQNGSNNVQQWPIEEMNYDNNFDQGNFVLTNSNYLEPTTDRSWDYYANNNYYNNQFGYAHHYWNMRYFYPTYYYPNSGPHSKWSNNNMVDYQVNNSFNNVVYYDATYPYDITKRSLNDILKMKSANSEDDSSVASNDSENGYHKTESTTESDSDFEVDLNMELMVKQLVSDDDTPIKPTEIPVNENCGKMIDKLADQSRIVALAAELLAINLPKNYETNLDMKYLFGENNHNSSNNSSSVTTKNTPKIQRSIYRSSF